MVPTHPIARNCSREISPLVEIVGMCEDLLYLFKTDAALGILAEQFAFARIEFGPHIV